MEVPLFFSGFLVEFLGSNEEGMGVGAYIEGGTLSPVGGRPPPSAALTEYRIVKFFFTKKACRPSRGRQGTIFVISWNGHIFLKFYFF